MEEQKQNINFEFEQKLLGRGFTLSEIIGFNNLINLGVLSIGELNTCLKFVDKQNEVLI